MSPLDAHAGDASRLLSIQAGLVAVVAVGFWFSGGLASVQAAAYGGGIALLTTFLLGRRVRMAMDAAKRQPGSETTVLYVNHRTKDRIPGIQNHLEMTLRSG